MAIIIDSREPNKISDSLKLKGIKIQRDFLDIGDYLLDDDYAIERKDDDLIQSIMNHRIFEQVNNLCNHKNPILAFNTENLWKMFYYSHSKYIHKQYIGAITTLLLSYPSLKLLPYNGENQFIEFIVSLDKKIHKEGTSERPQVMHRKTKQITVRMEDCLTAAKGISVKTSKVLLKKFGSIDELCKASLEDIQSIEGFGKVKAQDLFDLLHSKYEVKK